jgi:hypothetical protein
MCPKAGLPASRPTAADWALATLLVAGYTGLVRQD